MDGYVFRNDPDVYLLRDNDIELSKEQRRALVMLNHLFGAVYMTSDNVGEYNDGKREMLAEAQKLTAAEVKLGCGMKFRPQSYVRSAEPSGGELILPQEFTADRPETRLVQYQLKGKNETIRKNLRIRIVDETPPQLKLKTEKTELLKEAPFSCQSYVFSATDAVDGDLKADVHCSDILQDQETQTVEYTVKDSAGNTARTMLTVHFADYGETVRSSEPETVPAAPAPVYHAAPAAAVTEPPAVPPAPPAEQPEIEPLLS